MRLSKVNRYLICLLFPAFILSACDGEEPPKLCLAESAWVSNPSLPTEVELGKNATLCEFHKFSWQSFLYFMSPDAAGTERKFENTVNYPRFNFTGSSCSSSDGEAIKFVRSANNSTASNIPFDVPHSIQQAGDQAVIFDKNGNVVYYSIHFNRSLCAASLDPKVIAGNLPDDTSELKGSWRVITSAAEAANYITINATIVDGSSSKPALLGLVGFHVARTTPLHPEMIWATFEHKNNVPDCFAPQSPPAAGWSFLNATCAQNLNGSSPFTNPLCPLNVPQFLPLPANPPSTQICRVYRDGTRTGDNQYLDNISFIDQLNSQLTGPAGLVTNLPANNKLAVLKNYMLVGAIWENEVDKPSSILENQRGSIQLANSTAETTFQGKLPTTAGGTPDTAKNCFFCHTYTPGKTASTGLSHIFSRLHGTSSEFNDSFIDLSEIFSHTSGEKK